MAFEKQLPEWKAKGIKPPQNKLDEGWKAQDKPPAAWLNWQMNSTYEGLNELQQHAVDGRDVSAVPSPNGIVRLDGEGHLNEQVFADAKYKAIQFKPGVQVLESDVDTPLKGEGITGRTLINLFGANGDMKDISWLRPYDARISIDTTVEDTEGHCLKITAGNDEAHVTTGGVAFVPDMPFKSGKNYVAIVRIKNGTGNHAYMNIPGHGATSKLIKNKDRFEIAWLKFRPTLDTTTNFDIVVNGPNGVYAYYDSMRMYEISDDEFAALDGLSADKISERYPYVDGMTNVTNPYAIVTSENLLPPFTEWIHYGEKVSTKIIDSPYRVRLKAWADNAGYHYEIPCKANQTYTLTVEHDGMIALQDIDANKKLINDNGGYRAEKTITITTAVNAVHLSIRVSNGSHGTGVFRFYDPMLIVGPDSKPFQPQKRSMWAVEAHLAANPVTGADADVLYTGDDGLPYVLEKWEKLTLDGSLTWEFSYTGSGFKQVHEKNKAYPITGHQGYVMKFDGKILNNFSGIPSSADLGTISQNSGLLHITIANVDSGWGDTYTPTADEIKAYFLGWKMYDTNTGNTVATYSRTDNLYKGWARRRDDGAFVDGIGHLPTEQAPISAAWQTYRLQYLKSSPSVISVTNYETGAMLSTGTNVVEVGSGIVIREETKPLHNYINAINITGGRLKHQTIKLLEIYKDQMIDHLWTFKSYEWDGEVYQYGEYPTTPSPASYRVTYKMLSPTLAATLNVKLATNMRGTVAKLVNRTGDVERRLSVVEIQKTNKDEALHWIKPVLLSGWVNRNAPNDSPVSYLKDSAGFIHVRGLASEGASERAIFKFPKGYRPALRLQFIILSHQGGEGGGFRTSYITVEPTGDVYVNAGTGNQWMTMDNISFRAEQ